MRSSVVIKVNHTIDLIDRLFFIPVHFLLVYPFDLEDPVLSFRHGVVCRLISFCHAYPYVMLHEAADVSSLAYCDPLSEWCMVPQRLPPPAIRIAMRKASVVCEALRLSDRHQPNTACE